MGLCIWLRVQIDERGGRDMNNETRSCLTWSVEDIDLRLNAMGYTKEMTTERKQELLDDFFEYNEDIIMEFINQRLENFLSEEL